MKKLLLGFLMFLLLCVSLSANDLTGNDKILYNAVKEGNLIEVKMAIRMGANVNCLSNRSFTVLMLACRGSNYKIVKLLVENKAKLNLQDVNHRGGYTALMYAVRSAQLKIVKYLLAKKADATIKGRHGYTALSIAKRELSSYYGRYAHLYDIRLKKPYKAIVRLLGNPSKALIEAIRRGDYKLVVQSIKDGANVNTKDENDWTPLMIAITKGHKKIISYLKLKGAKVDSKVKNIK